MTIKEALHNSVLDPVTTGLMMISQARDRCAATGVYPSFPYGPGPDQSFDDWAADVAAETLDTFDEISTT